MIQSQMLKGILEGCILSTMEASELYGYEISERLRQYGFGKIAEGTIYPLLLRLEKNGLLVATYRASDIGPTRKYYKLSQKGMDEVRQFMKNYQEMDSAVQNLIKDTRRKRDE